MPLWTHAWASEEKLPGEIFSPRDAEKWRRARPAMFLSEWVLWIRFSRNEHLGGMIAGDVTNWKKAFFFQNKADGKETKDLFMVIRFL